MSIDVDREAVYAAERAAFDGTDLESVVPLAGLRSTAEVLTSGPWWPGPPVDLRPARSDAASSSAAAPGSAAGDIVVIRISAPQRTVATLSHELAHALAGPRAGHGPRYRRAALDLIGVITNLDTTARRGSVHVDQLADAFEQAGLSVGERSWPAPPPGVSGPIAL